MGTIIVDLARTATVGVVLYASVGT